MDEESLHDLSRLLDRRIGASVRGATCTALAGTLCGGSGSSTRHLLATLPIGEVILRGLLSCAIDTETSRLGLSALVNGSESEKLCERLVSYACVEQCIESLLDDYRRDLWGLWNALLINMTRWQCGVQRLTGTGLTEMEGMRMSGRVLRLLKMVGTRGGTMWVGNMCGSKQGREMMEKEQVMQVIQRGHGKKEDRIGVMMVMRGLGRDVRTHQEMIRGGGVKYCVERVGKEQDEEILKGIVEAIAGMCGTEQGKKCVHECEGFEALQEWSEKYCDGDDMKEVASVVEWTLDRMVQ